MPLRDASDVGVPDVRRFADLQVTDGAARAPVDHRNSMVAPSKQTARVISPLAAVPKSAGSGTALAQEPAVPIGPLQQSDGRRLLGDERLVHLQADVPDVVLQRVKQVSFELADDHPHLRHHQTMLGALIWSYVDHADQNKLDDLADLIDAYAAGPWRGLPEVRRLSGRMPASLKRRMEGTVLALAGTQRDVSAKTLVAALVWRHVAVHDDDDVRFARLVDVLGGYHQELSQRSVTAPIAQTRGAS
jgi:hypothetical protein